MKYLFMICFALVACRAKRDNEPTAIITHDSRVEALLKKKELYCELGRQYGAKTDWNFQGCDSLLFTSLWSVACGEIPLSGFMDESTGQLFRTTDHGCFPGPGKYGDSKSSISKDMFRGFFLYAYRYHARDLYNKAVSFSENHDYFVGDAVDQQTRISRCLLSPDMITEMKDLQEKLDDPLNENFHIDEDTDEALIAVTGFEAHLQVLKILFHGRLYGGISDSEKQTLRDQAERQPNNALFALVYKTYQSDAPSDNALSVLEDENYFPNGRLPVALDRSSSYLWERDESAKDWGPGDGPEEWPGVDFVIAASILGQK